MKNLETPWKTGRVGRYADGKRFKIAITSMFSGREDVPEKKGMDLCKQMSSKSSFTCICGIVLPLNPSATTVYARSAFYPNLHFTLSLQSAFYTLSAFYPWSAVCSLRFPLTVKNTSLKDKKWKEKVEKNAQFSF